MPIFRVKSVKIYTGQKNLHWRRQWQLSGMLPSGSTMAQITCESSMILFVGLSSLCHDIPDEQQFKPLIPEGVSCSPREAKSWQGLWTHLRHRRRLRVWSACPLFVRLAICKVVDFGLGSGWDLCLGEFLVKSGEVSNRQVSTTPQNICSTYLL